MSQVSWRVLASSVNVCVTPPVFSEARWEDIKTDNPFFQDCETAWEVEDVYLLYWNRLNESTARDAKNYYLHRPTERVVVLRVEPA